MTCGPPQGLPPRRKRSRERHEVININVRNKPEWYYTKHPFGQIPGLENSQCHLIYESVVACEYLDGTYPGGSSSPMSLISELAGRCYWSYSIRYIQCLKQLTLYLDVFPKFQSIFKAKRLVKLFCFNTMCALGG
ncbi:Glutathione S-Transferase Omega-2 [Manis pentadactyla]|nr:Glutathione S-Transferase Omega-2 [Manis pentadactyla]